ncbi:MAG: hypothetical protein DRQ88_06410 [Epsilonproteobacteria bacterium]|nr:MAG: hypothetical protein DRQ89_04880 [Campylobacterota bacterium]RLA66429.1 MAG: hypothetical protein DRQ88_06410 [Campylobacterota bacterium]
MEQNPLEERVFKLKNPRMEFFCPLCRSQRGFLYSPKLSKKNYMQIVAISLMLAMSLYPFMGFRSGVVLFMVWGIMEFSIRVLFKKEVPCPHCGFDATWYKKDIKVARQKVKEFWEQKKHISDTEKFAESI